MRIGLVGCGFTSDFYIDTLKQYPQLELAGATDSDQQRAAKFCSYHSLKHIPTPDAMLADPSIELIVNLTNSRSHFAVSKACLEAGKHVYSEKPLATKFCEARELVELAEAKGLQVSSAPCSLLGETAQTVWKALSNKEIGTVRAVYAELDDGPFHMQEPHLWRSASDAVFPYKEEFEVGITIEHASHYLTWLTAFFGPAKTIKAFASCQWPDKQLAPDVPLYVTVPDLSVACITFASGVVVRLTCSFLGPHNHELKIIGDTGMLTVEECWNYSSPVYLDKYSQKRFRVERYPITRTFPFIKNWMSPHKIYPAVKKASWKKQQARFRQDYARGVADLARAITEHRPPQLPADYCLHVTELACAINDGGNEPYQVTTTFKPLQPMDAAALKQIPANW